MMNTPMKFAFLDEGETLRRLGVDRDTLLALIAEKRLRTYPGVGKGNFFRARDVEALYAELHAGAGDDAPAASAGESAPAGRKLFDPAYKVHVRLQADLKWYDLEDEDLKAWAREMTPEGYARQRQNIEMVIAKLRRMRDLMDETAAGWQHLPAPRTAAEEPAPRANRADTTPPTLPARTRERRRQLPVLGDAATQAITTAPAPPAPPAHPARPRRPRRDLPMLGNVPPPESTGAQ